MKKKSLVRLTFFVSFIFLLSACNVFTKIPSKSTLNSLVGKDSTEIFENIGRPNLSWPDRVSGNPVLVYTQADMGYWYPGFFPRTAASPVEPVTLRRTRLLYLDGNGVCRKWEKF